jgi:hypothetical protein
MVVRKFLGRSMVRLLGLSHLNLVDDLIINRMDEKDPAAKVLTGISDECRVQQCNSCPGIFFPEQAWGEPVFCTHVCHQLLSARGTKTVS